MTTPREKYERRRETFNRYTEDGKIDKETGRLVKELLNTYDNDKFLVAPPEDEGTRKSTTLMSWLYPL